MPLTSVKDRLRHYLNSPPDLEQEFASALEKSAFFRCPEQYVPLLLSPMTPDLELAQQQTLSGSFAEAQLFLRNHIIDRQSHRLLLPKHRDALQHYAHQNPLFFQHSTRQGEEILNHEYNFPGQPFFYMEPLTNWYYDFLGHSWFFAPYRDLLEQFKSIPNLNSELQGNWSLNTLWFFTSLGRSYTLTGNEIFVGEFLVQFVDWKDKNPCLGGIAWLHPHVVAARAFHIVQALNHFIHSPQLSPQLCYQVLESLIEHILFLAWSLQLHDDHHVTTALSLWWLCQEFPELRLAQRFQERAETILQKNLADIQPPDTTESCILLEWLIACGLRPQDNVAFTEMLSLKIQELLGYLQPFQFTGLTPSVHQCTSLLTEPQNPVDYVRHLHVLGNLYLNKPLEAVTEPENCSELTWWNPLWTQELRIAKTAPSDSGSSLSALSPIIPVTYLKTPHVQLQLFGENVSHSHHGLHLSFTLNDEPILIHPGNGFCALPEERHKVTQRFACSCPTPIVPNRERLAFSSQLKPPRKIEKGILLEASLSVHDRVREQELGAIHRRVLLRTQEQLLLIEDSHTFTSPLPMHTGFLFAPHLKIFVRGDRGGVAQSSRQLVRVQPIIDKPFDGDLFLHSERPCRGWATSEDGSIIGAPMLCYLTQPRQTSSTSYFLLSWTDQTPPQYDPQQLKSWLL